MEEELFKRHTDCVYFLASPLTCKKGIECEYRHSEIARLNPRECWYWLSGSCFNHGCAFRHPPLDGLNQEVVEPAPISVPVNKTNVPCYYYFNGYCSKGESCSFLHDTVPEPSQQAIKPVKAPEASQKAIKSVKAPENSEALQLKKNTLTGTDLVSKPPTAIEEPDRKEFFQMPVKNYVPEAINSMVYEDEETTEIRPCSDLNEYQSLDEEEIYEDEIEGDIRQEERWESSSGFDVLVDGDKLEEDEVDNFGSEDGQEYITSEMYDINQNDPEMYDIDQNDLEIYDIDQNDPEMYYRREDNFGDAKDIIISNSLRTRMFDVPVSARLSAPMRLESGFGSRRRSDIRHRLGRQSYVERLHKPSRVIVKRIQDRPWLRSKRLDSKNGKFARQNSTKRFSFKKQHGEEKRVKKKRLMSEVSRESSGFSGPKTLAQIREEKRIVRENGDFSGNNQSKDFEGPRPLSEILKEKGKL